MRSITCCGAIPQGEGKPLWACVCYSIRGDTLEGDLKNHWTNAIIYSNTHSSMSLLMQ